MPALLPGMALGAAPEVQTSGGRLRGLEQGVVYVFRGVPFAEAPFGARHMQPPQPRSWDGVRDATAFGPKPPQAEYPPQVAPLIPPELSSAGEDCLTLNIWTTDLGAARLPVLVWIAGGMFEYHATGASPLYDGTRFAKDGVVLVSINYRVGAEGFLYLGDGTANLGLLDQLAALEWVRENIAAFGGDPDKVTVFGESAGALSIATLLSMPRAEGLFARAIVESGGAQHVSSAATGLRIGQLLAGKLGVPPTREAIAVLTPQAIIAAQNALRVELATRPDPALWGEVMLTNLPWQPVVDGDVLPALPIERIRSGAGAGVDLMVGSNTEEWRLFLVPGGVIDTIQPQMLAATIGAFGLPADQTVAAYRARQADGSVGDIFAAVMTDWYWRVPALRLADAHAAAAAANTFMYEFGWRSPAFAGRLGACHAIEIPFAFDTLAEAASPLLGASPPQPLADRMHAAWVTFARSGNPGWPGYDAQQQATMRFNEQSGVVDAPMAWQRTIWDGVR
ncbi:MAG: carboxylesterase/lipase family protein [Devosia sp.]